MSDDTPTTPVDPPRRGRRTAILGVGIGVGALVLGGGAFAYSQLSGGGPQPADVMPASTDAYVRIDLDPSAGQKVELFRLLRQVPEVGEAVGIDDPDRDDVRRLVFDEVLSDACADLSYDEDVEPWLGDRVGVGVEGDAQSILIAAQVDDETAAREGIDALFACADEDEYVVDFAEGYALISNQQSSIDAAVDAVRDGETLATSEDFTADMDALGDQGVASAWVDVEGLVQAFAEDPTIADSLDEETRAQLEEAGSAALTLRADGSALELAAVSGAPRDDLPRAPIGDLPGDTVVALSFAGAGEQVSEQWAQVEEAFESGFGALESGLDDTSDDGLDGAETTLPPLDPDVLAAMDPETRAFYESLYAEEDGTSTEDPDPQTAFDGNPLEAFEQATGLALPEDLSTLLGDTFTLAVGAANLETVPTSSGPDDLGSLDIGLRTTGDAAEAEAVLQKLADLAADAGLELFVEPTDDGAVLATNADAASNLTGGGDLGSSPAFEAAMPFGDEAVGGLFVDVGTILDKLLESDPPEDVRADLEDATAIDAAGMSAAVEGDHLKLSVRLAFAD